jgi:FecR protein
MSARNLIGWTSSIVALAWALNAPPAHAQKAGVASAVRNDVSGVIGGSTRKLSAGTSVFSSELIRTGDASLAQLTFLDETTLSVAAKSEVKITRFVYDPNRPSSSKVISASKGALRFVSGSSNPSSYKVETPSASIGVRGTIIDILLWLNGSMTAILVEGAFRAIARATGIVYNIVTPGQALTIALNGAASQTTWQWSIYNFVGNAPFPLFGDNTWPNQTFILPHDSTRSLVDQITPRIFETIPQPTVSPSPPVNNNPPPVVNYPYNYN